MNPPQYECDCGQTYSSLVALEACQANNHGQKPRAEIVCTICRNDQGFAFGTCIECGWNYLDNTFHWIEVQAEDLASLSESHRDALIVMHLQRKHRQ
jgi:predicted ATP-dependent serine protease